MFYSNFVLLKNLVESFQNLQINIFKHFRYRKPYFEKCYMGFESIFVYEHFARLKVNLDENMWGVGWYRRCESFHIQQLVEYLEADINLFF